MAIFVRDLQGSLQPYTVSGLLTGGQLLRLLRHALALPSGVYLCAGGRPLRPHLPLCELSLRPGSTIDVLATLSGGAPNEPPPKRPRSLPRPDALALLRAFLDGPFVVWRQRIPPAELACDLARLVGRWSAAGAPVPGAPATISEALGLSADQTLELLWAWELVCGWVYDPCSDTFSQPSPMDLDSAASGPLDEVARLRRELERVTLEAASLRAQVSPPLTEANLLQLLAAAPPASQWVHALGEALLQALQADPPVYPSTPASPASAFAHSVWLVLQRFALAPSSFSSGAPRPPPAPAGPPTAPSQGVCVNCGLPGHWARNCRQARPHGAMPHPQSPPFRQGALSVLPTGQTVFTAASGRTYDVASSPPYPCSRCNQSHWFFQPCPARADPPQAS